MRSKELLFELIHSLSKSEKRFIKLNATLQGSDKVYLRLMDAIAKQKEYDEEELMKFFKDEEFIKQFSVAKNYLQNFILKQLRQYHSDLKANITCKHLLNDIEVLFWKGQYKLAEKLIYKTEKIASKYELFLILEELNNWSDRIYSALLTLDKKSVSKTIEKHNDNIRRYQNILSYKELISKAHLLTKQSEIIRDNSEFEAYQDLINHPLLQDESKAESYAAKYSYYVLNGVLKRIAGDINESGRYRKKLVEFLESKPHLLEENPIHYTAALHNVLMHSLIIHDHDLYHEYIEKLRNYNFKMPHEKANMFSSLCLFELGYYTEYSYFDKAVKFVEETVSKYDGVNNLLNLEHEFLLHYHAALAYYHLEDYNSALKWINNVINRTSKDLRVDVRASTYVLNILAHYELNNIDLLPYLIRTTLNYLRSVNMHTEYDNLFVAMFDGIPLKSNRIELVVYLESKKKELNKIQNISMLVSDIDYITWIDSKIKNCKLSTLRKINKEENEQI